MRKLTLSTVVVVLTCLSLGATCNRPTRLFIDSPAHGVFIDATSTIVSGRLTKPSGWTLTVNGTTVPVVSGTWSTSVPLDANAVFNPVLVEATKDGNVKRERIVIIAGDSRADGAFSESSVALRLNDSGLDAIEPLVESLTAGALDIEAFLIAANPVATTFVCVIPNPFGGCITGFTVTVDVTSASFSSFGLDVDAMTNFAAGDIVVSNIDVRYDTDGIDCQGRITSPITNILGDYDLSPDSVDPSNIDVNLISSIGVSFSGFSNQFTGGICDFPIIGDIIQLIIGNVQPLVTDGLVNALSDPDGAGPLDSPIADGIEVALADISISGPIGQSLGAILETPLFAVTEDVDGITLGSDSSFVRDCTPPPGAPDLLASYHIDEVFPPFGPNTPVGGLPYGMGMCISTSSFNQLLKAQVECGLLVTSITELSLDGVSPPEPLTSDLLAAFIPEFGIFTPGTPLRIDVIPTLAPVVTGATGPGGELAELRISHLNIDLVIDGLGTLILGGHVDTVVGLDLTFDNATGSLVFNLAPPTAGEVSVVITTNTIGANAGLLENFVLPGLVAALLPDLAGSLGEFPLPAFLGLNLEGIEVSRNGEFMSLFADLTPAP